MDFDRVVGSLAAAERVVLRLLLYAMIAYGLTASSADPIDRLTDRLHFLLGLSALAVVAWVSRPASSRSPGVR